MAEGNKKRAGGEGKLRKNYLMLAGMAEGNKKRAGGEGKLRKNYLMLTSNLYKLRGGGVLASTT